MSNTGPRIGLVGLDALASRLTEAGFEVTSDPDLKSSVQALNAAAKEHGKIATLVLNSIRVKDLIPRIYRHVNLTVLGTEDAPVREEEEGYLTYQLPGNVRDILKNTGIEGFDFESFPENLELDPMGRVIDLDNANWDDWDPDREAVKPRRSAGVAEDADDDDLFGVVASVRNSLRGTGPRGGMGEVAIALSGSGGVGKTTFSISLASRAADRGKRVVLIDGNLGQGDTATFLRVAGSNLPTMYDALLDDNNLHTALITPAQLNDVRNVRLKKVNFAYVQAPSEAENKTGRVTPVVLNDLIDSARRIADLVVVDTQIIETDDPRGMVESVIIPQLGQGAWAISIASLSSPGMVNLLRVMKQFKGHGIDPSHVLSVMSRMPVDVVLDNQDEVVAAFRQLSVHLGSAWEDNEILMAMNRGELVADTPALANILDTALHRVFDMPIRAATYDPHQVTERKRWPWSRSKPGPRHSSPARSNSARSNTARKGE